MSEKNGKNKLTLVDFAISAKEDLTYIRAEVENFDNMSDTLERVDVSLESINTTLGEIKTVLKDFSKFSMNLINRVLTAMFVIILSAMGVKGVLDLINLFGK